jgi:hypothetical protein
MQEQFKFRGDTTMSITMIEQSTANSLAEKVKAALQCVLAGEGTLPNDILTMEGMSGRKYRQFINKLVSLLDDARYLEVGSWAGSTLCSAVHDNAVSAMAIDNWSLFGGPYKQFYSILARFKTPDAKLSFLEEDFRNVDFTTIGKFNVYLFDGPHTTKDQYDGVTLAQPALDDHFVLIVDDWNWQQVRDGTMKAIRDCNITIEFAAEIRSSLDNTQPPVRGQHSDWHNGYFISALSRHG